MKNVSTTNNSSSQMTDQRIAPTNVCTVRISNRADKMRLLRDVERPFAARRKTFRSSQFFIINFDYSVSRLESYKFTHTHTDRLAFLYMWMLWLLLLLSVGEMVLLNIIIISSRHSSLVVGE